MAKIDKPNKHEVGCLLCAGNEGLKMWPHRHPNAGTIGGWVFLCAVCEKAVVGKDLEIKVVD